MGVFVPVRAMTAYWESRSIVSLGVNLGFNGSEWEESYPGRFAQSSGP